LIAVIADDLAGAAEMGGVALRYGLTAEVQTEFNARRGIDVIVVDTDTRSCMAQEAAQRVADVIEQCRKQGARQIYKKVDSVLRGHILAELTVLLTTWGKSRALLVPANPGLGRAIVGGQCFIHGQPLHQTDFAWDPEYPATTSDVLVLLGPAGPFPVTVMKPNDDLPEQGILVGEAARQPDLAAWARRLDDRTMPAGAAEFFGAVLSAAGLQPRERLCVEVMPAGDTSALFVCGSTSAYSRSFCGSCEARGLPVLRMPLGLFECAAESRTGPQAHRLILEWAEATVTALRLHRRAMVAIDRPPRRDPGLPQALGSYLSELTGQVLRKQNVDHLLVEGGATAAALVRGLGWRRLSVRRELQAGVVCLQAEGIARPLLTMKPGSYTWPTEISRFLSSV
jgi:uncharacterized protein YgbK (DUF1537 family)